MIYHIAGFFIGFIMDLLLGDPYWLPHPIRLIGKLIAELDKKLLGDISERERNYKKEFMKGICLTVLVLVITVAVTAIILCSAYKAAPLLGLAVESIMSYQMLATKC